jgi:hypothetical protein
VVLLMACTPGGRDEKSACYLLKTGQPSAL